MSCTGLEPTTTLQLLTAELEPSSSEAEVTAFLHLIPNLPNITPAQGELIWRCVPSPYLSKLVASSLRFDNDSNTYAPILVTLLSSVRASPRVLHSLSYLNYAPVLLKIAYCAQYSVVKEIRQLSMECLECVSYIPECQSILLHEGAIGIIISSIYRDNGLSLITLSNLQECDEFSCYSHQTIEELQRELSSCEQLGKYNHCELIKRVLSCFGQFQFEITESLSFLLRDLFILIRHKVGVKRQLSVLLATTQLLSLFDLYALCEHLNANRDSKFSLTELLDLLLLTANLVVVNFKLWLDEYMHSGDNKFSQSCPMLVYTQQLIRMLERVEENDCLVLRSTDKCYDFICQSILTIEDIFISLCHLLMCAKEKSYTMDQTLSRSILKLLSLFLTDHELNKHSDLLTKLCPILTQLMCSIPMDQYYGEINKFEFSLLHDYTTLSNFLFGLESKLSDQMLDFLPAAMNLSQLSNCLTDSGYLHLLLAYFSKLFVAPVLNKITSDSSSDIRSAILDIVLTQVKSHTVADTTVFKLFLSLILISWNASTDTICQSEHELINLLTNALCGCDFNSYLPLELTTVLQDFQKQ